MACCSKLTDVIPSIESLGNRMSQNAIAPIKRARDRWSSPSVAAIDRIRSRTWFSRERGKNDEKSRERPQGFLRMSRSGRVVDVEAGEPMSKSVVKSEAEELEEFVAETRRKSAGSRKRRDDRNRTKYRVRSNIPSNQSRGERTETAEDKNEEGHHPAERRRLLQRERMRRPVIPPAPSYTTSTCSCEEHQYDQRGKTREFYADESNKEKVYYWGSTSGSVEDDKTIASRASTTTTTTTYNPSVSCSVASSVTPPTATPASSEDRLRFLKNQNSLRKNRCSDIAATAPATQARVIRRETKGVFVTSLLHGAAYRGQGEGDVGREDQYEGAGKRERRAGGGGDESVHLEDCVHLEESSTDASKSSPSAHSSSIDQNQPYFLDVKASAEIWRRAQRRSKERRSSGSRKPTGHGKERLRSPPQSAALKESRLERRPKMANAIQRDGVDDEDTTQAKPEPKDRRPRGLLELSDTEMSDVERVTHRRRGEGMGDGDEGIGAVAEGQSFENITFAEFENWILSRRKSRRL